VLAETTSTYTPINDMIVLVFGLPGSGKTYFASRLAEKIKAVHLNSDNVRKDIGEWDRYKDASKEYTYDVMLKKMQDAIQSGKDAVVDATFYKEALRDKFLHASAKLHQQCKMIEVRAPEEIIQQRVSKPRPDSQADYEVYKKIKREFEPVREEHLVLVSESGKIKEMLEKALSYLSAA
jgi:hypothetical protein